MAGAKDMIIGQFGASQYLIDAFTADLSDEEYFKVAAPRTNHTGWCLGHIAASEDSMTAAATGANKRLPESMHELFRGGGECHPDKSKYPARNQIDEMFKDARAHTLESLRAFSENRWDDPAPDAYPKELFPSLGSLWGLMATHAYWHIGQIASCRAALGKDPVLGIG